MRAPRWSASRPALRHGLVLAAACSSDGASGDDAAADETTTTEAPALPAGYEGSTSKTYADDAHWLCKPGIADDASSIDLDATSVAADGSTEVEPHEAAAEPPVDCFYVYPTTSRDATINSDLVPAEGEEIVTVWNQVARLSSTCRVFAPVYRQISLAALLGGGATAATDGDPRAIAYGDVVDAFTDYVANESERRGFVLLGHSQGAGMITRLIEDEIDDEPLLRDRLVAAYVLGSTVQVPEGEVVGGSFAEVPPVRGRRPDGVRGHLLVVPRHPAPGRRRHLRPGRRGHAGGLREPGRPRRRLGDPAPVLPPRPAARHAARRHGGHPAVRRPGAPGRRRNPVGDLPRPRRGECVTDGAYSYVSLTVHSDAGDARTDDIGGDLTDEWGMHLVDANVAMGDIEALVASQADAYTG